MIALYLWFNAVAFIALSLWCATAVDSTATKIGYQTLSASGRCEYTAVYGGLQFAIGIVFALAARRPEFRWLGLSVALAIYTGIVVFRLVGLIRFWPVSSTTLTIAGFELTMCVIALALKLMPSEP